RLGPGRERRAYSLLTSTNTTDQSAPQPAHPPSPWDAPAPTGGHDALGGAVEAAEGDRSGSVVSDRAVVSAPDSAAATPAALLPVAADHYALFQDVAGEDLQAWADARSLYQEVLHRITDWSDRGE